MEGVQEARFAKKDLDAEETGVSHMRLKLDDEIIEVERLDAIRVSPEVMRNFEAGPDGIEVLAVGRRHDGDGEVAPAVGGATEPQTTLFLLSEVKVSIA